MTDLTKIKKPFGLLKPEVQVALKAHGGPYEFYNNSGWCHAPAPRFHQATSYRVSPKAVPTPDQFDWSQLPVEFKWAGRDESGGAYVFVHRPRIERSQTGHFSWWITEGPCIRIDELSLYTRGTVDWKDSLQERPQ